MQNHQGNSAQHRLALPAGARVHWYEVESVLGKGGFGITYLGRDTNLDKPVAIKEFLPTEFATRDADLTVHPNSSENDGVFQWGLSRFIDEARLLSRFEHPNIVRVYTVFEEHNTGYMVMTYEQGGSLKALLNQTPTLSQERLLGILMPILDGLEQVHDQHFIHRDIKPDNIVLRPDGSPVLIDFGSARQALEGESRTMTSMVSPGYAPYEQYYAKGDEQGPWTDIYSLGATLYRAISGVNPVDAVTRSRALLDGKPDPLPLLTCEQFPDYDEALLAAVNQSLRFRASERPQTLAQWRALLTSDATVVVPPAGLATTVHGGTTKVASEATFLEQPGSEPKTSEPGAPGYESTQTKPAPPKGALAAAGIAATVVVLGAVGWVMSGAPESSQPNPTETREITQLQQAVEREQAELANLEAAQLQAQQALAQQKALQEQQALKERQEQEQARQAALAQAEREQQQAEAEARAREEAKAQALAQQKAAEAARREREARIAESRAAFQRRDADKIDPYGFADYPMAKPLNDAITVAVQAKPKQWQSAGVLIEQGKRYQIRAEGSWSMGSLCKPSDATGEGIYTLACWDGGGETVAGYSHGALIGKIGKGALAFYVGPEFVFTGVEDGPLYFMSNDASPYFGDNSGALNVTITPLD